MKKVKEHLKTEWYKYVLEMIVITAGILGAYSLNNWNENSKNKKLEQAYLSDINSEFKKNKEQFTTIMGYFQIIADSCSQVQPKFPLTPINWDANKQEIMSLWRGASFDPLQSSIESLINASSIDLIQDRELKKSLLAWIPVVKDWKEEELQLTQSIYDLGEWMRKNTDGYDGWKLMNSAKLFELQNLIIARCFWQDYILNGGPNTDNETKDLVDMMDDIIDMTEPYAQNEKSQ